MTDYPVSMDVTPDVEDLFDEATNTISYIVKDPTPAPSSTASWTSTMPPAHALLAGLPPGAGIYASIAPILLYAVPRITPPRAPPRRWDDG